MTETKATIPPTALPAMMAEFGGEGMLCSTCEVGMTGGVYNMMDDVVVRFDWETAEGSATGVEAERLTAAGKPVDGMAKDIDEAFSP